MTADVIDLRTRPRLRPPVRPRSVPPRPLPVPARPRPVPVRPLPSRRPRRSVRVWVGPVVEWDGVRGLYVATCDRCAETMTATSSGPAYSWAEGHECDPELAALLDDLDGTAA